MKETEPMREQNTTKSKDPQRRTSLIMKKEKKLTREEPKEQNPQSPKTEKKEAFLTQISKQRKLLKKIHKAGRDCDVS